MKPTKGLRYVKMDSELKELKSVLRSIVVSSPAQVDVRSLMRDYRNMVGTPLPLAKYGYKDVLTFLKERCNDCFLGIPSNPVLTLIVPDNLKHIDQFVRKQRTSGAAKMKGKRRSVAETIVKPPLPLMDSNLICSTFNRNHVAKQQWNHNEPRNTQPVTKPPDIREQITKSNDIPTSSIRNSCKDVTTPTDKIKSSCKDVISPTDKIKSSSKDVTDHTQYTKSLQNLKPVNENVNLNTHVVANGCPGNVRNFFKKRLPMYDSSQYLDNEICSEQDRGSSKDDNDSGRQTSSSQSSTKRAQLEELKCEIHELIKEHKRGIWCIDLMRLYRERYGRELSFDRFGHNNINSLLRSMQDRIAFSTESGGLRLKDAASAGAGAPPVTRVRTLPRPLSHRVLPVDPDDALPGIDFEADVFPTDCVHFMESIPPLALGGGGGGAGGGGEVSAGAMLEVVVGEVYSPSHFWLQRLGDAYSIALDEVMDDMTKYYQHGEGKSRVLSAGAVRVGHYCSSVYDNDWHRSLIVKLIDVDTVKVRHVDYGTVDTVSAGALKPLLRRWAALPAQAVRARLAGLRPGAGGRRWPHAAAAHFLHLVRDQRLVANVVALDPQEDIIETFLINTSGPDDVCLTNEMIRSGHADPRPDSALRTGECYLYPRFDVLESGETPNFAEIHRYLADGISLEYVDAYRRHVPAALPASSHSSSPKSLSPPTHSPLSPPPSPSASPAPLSPPHSPRVPPLRLHSPAAPSPTPSPAPAASCSLLSSSPKTPPAYIPTPDVETPQLIRTNAPTPQSPVSSTVSTPPPIVSTNVSTPPSTVTTVPTPLPSASNVIPTSTSKVPPTFPTNITQEWHPPVPAQWQAPPPQQWMVPGPRCPGQSPGGGEVRLTVQECEMYTLLCSLDPEAAHCYMVSALRRAHAPPPPPRPLNPHAPEFRIAFPAAYGVAPAPPRGPPPRGPPPRGPPPQPFMRPPPGF